MQAAFLQAIDGPDSFHFPVVPSKYRHMEDFSDMYDAVGRPVCSSGVIVVSQGKLSS